MHVYKHLLEHKGALAAVAVLLLVQAFCDLALPGYTADIVDVGIAGFGPDQAAEQQAYLLGVGGRMLLVTAIGAVAAILVSLIASRTAATIGRNLRNRLFANVVRFSDAEVQGFSAASLITRGTNDVQQIQVVCMITMRMVLFAPILALGGIVMVVRTNVSMSWIIVLAVCVVLAIIVMLMVITLAKFKMLQQLIDRVNLVAREIITGLPVIRAFNRQRHEEERFDVANETLMRTQLFTNRAMVFMMPTTQLVMNGVSALIVWVGAAHVDAGTLQTGDMIAFITYSIVIIMGFMVMSMVAIMLPRAEVAAVRVDEVLATASSIQDPAEPRDDMVGKGKGVAISFDHVTFGYDDDSEPVLNDVSFDVPAGSSCAIIGATGSGKSTVLKLMMRFYDVQAGAVRIDGVDVRDISQHRLHELLGYVPQHSFLFSGTIESNIAYAHDQLSSQQVGNAAQIAQAREFIDSKEEGLQSAISQSGTNISGGQRQRLAIARAVAANTPALLFDDSFSALDYATDAALRSALATELAGKTRIIVAQRIATIADADQIVVIDGGSVVGTGTHSQLMDTCKVYRQIAESQLSSDELAEGGLR